VSYATALSGSTVESSSCTGEGCSAHEYDPAKSTTATQVSSSEELAGPNRRDDTGVQEWEDILSTNEAANIRIGFKVTPNAIFTKSGGALGLGPSQDGSTNYVDTLYNAKRITSKMVSWLVVAAESETALMTARKHNVSDANTTVKFGTDIPDSHYGDMFYLNSSSNAWAVPNVTLSYNG